jgi:hypothetical protein
LIESYLLDKELANKYYTLEGALDDLWSYEWDETDGGI